MTSNEQLLNELIAANNHVSLATIMCQHVTSPYNSMVQYSQAQDGSLILLLGDLSQHTKNIKQVANASLMIAADHADQASDFSQVSMQVELVPAKMDSTDVQRYYFYYPEAQRYVDELACNFYRADVSRVEWIVNFNKVFQYSNEVIKSSPFSYQEEQSMVEHMNRDHSKAIQHYCDKESIIYDLNDLPVLAGISAYGFHVRANNKLYWFAFDSMCGNVNCVRKALVKMAQS